MRRNIFLTIILGLAMGLTSCSKSEDSVKPEIIIKAPVKNDTIKTEDLHFEILLSDNEGLKSYKIDIHSADEHTHSIQLSKAVTKPWVYQASYDLEGKRNSTEHKHVSIPETAPSGNYHFVIYCTDTEGNEAHTYVTFYLSADRHEHEEH